jgi:quercetin dioxygenase-like cupin family protein
MTEFAEVEWLARAETVQVRINTLAAGAGTPWHFHTAVTDDVFCLDPGLQVELRAPDATVPLRPGERQHVEPRRVHRVVNAIDRPLRYLLVQANGAYDFNPVR